MPATVSYNAATNTATLTPTSPLGEFDDLHDHGRRRHRRRDGSGRQCPGGECLLIVHHDREPEARSRPVWSDSTMPTTVDSWRRPGHRVRREVHGQRPVATSPASSSTRPRPTPACIPAACGRAPDSCWPPARSPMGPPAAGRRLSSRRLWRSRPARPMSPATTRRRAITRLAARTSLRPYTNGPLTVWPRAAASSCMAPADSPRSPICSNYWVEPLFSSVAPVDTTPPTVVSVSPAGQCDERSDKRQRYGRIQRSLESKHRLEQHLPVA